jgi:hypothetical protein
MRSMLRWRLLGGSGMSSRADADQWEQRAIAVAATLNRAADELTRLIEDIRRKARQEEGAETDDRSDS